MAENRFDRRAAVIRRLAAIPQAVRAAARDGVNIEAAFMAERIRSRVPRDEGELAASVEWHPNPRLDKIGAVVTEGRGQENDPLNRKARAIEFGRPDAEAQPHFFPTYRAEKRAVQNRIQKRVRSAIGRIWGSSSK
jgi:hypothetical protein